MNIQLLNLVVSTVTLGMAVIFGTWVGGITERLKDITNRVWRLEDRVSMYHMNEDFHQKENKNEWT